jgi:hypothetical protein
MTMAMRAVGTASEKAEVIRLGLVGGDGRLEERIVSLAASVVIGPVAQSGVSFVVPGLSAPQVLVSRRGERLVLHVTRGMKARVATATGTRELEGRDEEVELDARGRGKVVIGRLTLLFQLAAAPPKRLVPALPASVRGGLLRQLDTVFTALVACSFLGHFGFVVYLESADWPISASLAQVPDHVAELIFDDPVPPTPPDETTDQISDDETPDDETPTDVAETETPRTDRPDRTTPRDDSTPSTPTMSEDEVRMAMGEATQAVTDLIGAVGIGGSIQDTLAGGRPDVSAEEVMAGVSGVEIASTTNVPRMRDGSSTSGPTDLGHLRPTTRTGPVREGDDVVETGPRPTTHTPAIDEIEIDDGMGEFDQRAVVRMIQTRRAQITACYEHAILSDPTLRGRIEIQMTIEESGSVSGVRTVENGMGSDTVARCIETRVRGFRFTPGPTGGSVQFRFPFVFEQQR